jgi:hypothetical protein
MSQVQTMVREIDPVYWLHIKVAAIRRNLQSNREISAQIRACLSETQRRVEKLEKAYDEPPSPQ